MKLISLFSLIFLVSACASYRPSEKSSLPGESAKESQPKKSSRPVKKSESLAVWDLLNKEKMTLYFRNVDNGTRLTVILGKRITEKEIPNGHWELTGFAAQGKSFVSMNTTKKFVFKMNPSAHTYGGSIVVGCPQITAADNGYLKSMKFFNRYPFTSRQGLCEIVIGNDFASVSEAFKKSRKNKNLELKIGF